MKLAGATAATIATRPIPLFAGTPRVGKQPNLLIVVCDQMVLDAIGAYRNYFAHKSWLCHWVDTPNLDELAHMQVSRLHRITAA